MTDHRIDADTPYDTGKSNLNQLVYERSPGVNWNVFAVDYAVLSGLSAACNAIDIASGSATLAHRAKLAAKAAMDNWLLANNGTPDRWDVFVDNSQPSNGTWTVDTNNLWIHILYRDSTTFGVAAAEDSGTYRVSQMEVVEDVTADSGGAAARAGSAGKAR